MTIDFREVSFQLSWMNMNESFHHQPPLRDGWMKTFNLRTNSIFSLTAGGTNTHIFGYNK
jgi:hypothetical protein